MRLFLLYQYPAASASAIDACSAFGRVVLEMVNG